jgi:hypothetical protein
VRFLCNSYVPQFLAGFFLSNLPARFCFNKEQKPHAEARRKYAIIPPGVSVWGKFRGYFDVVFYAVSVAVIKEYTP